MKISLRLLLIFYSLNSTIAQAQQIEADGSVNLPAHFADLQPGSKPEAPGESVAWTEFCDRNGDWVVNWNTDLATPHRAFGPPIQIEKWASVTMENVDQAGKAFITQELSDFGINPNNLELKSVRNLSETWFLSYGQTHMGYDVLFSEIELRISPSGKVFMLGFDYYLNIPNPSDFELGSRNKLLATKGLNDGEVAFENSQIEILPLLKDDGASFHYVKRYNIKSTIKGDFTAFVDIINHSLLWRKKNGYHATLNGTVDGTVQQELPTDQFLPQSFAHLDIDVDGIEITSDQLGNFTVDSDNDSVTVTAKLEGPYVRVIKLDGGPATFVEKFPADDSINISWTDLNSHKDERNAFYHTNIAHDSIKGIDPEATYVDYAVPVRVRRGGVCGPNSDGIGIFYDKVGGGCVSGTSIANVNYHEYAHVVNHQLYRSIGRTQGMQNQVLNEATADIFGCLMVNDPVFAPGWTGPGTSTRRLDVTRSYPSGVRSTPHETGLILSGAFWELGELTTPWLAQRLAHFAKYGGPDDPDVGTAFREYYVATLVADDDDNDLSNGTPHFDEIYAVFSKRNIHVDGLGPEMEEEEVVTTINRIEEPILNFYPNPFSKEIEFQFTLASPAKVNISIYDLEGKLITQLLEKNRLQGEQSIKWSGRKTNGELVAPGIYNAVLNIDQTKKTFKVIFNPN
ncbi:MAG: T9SS type A sorting domain-containing protein [Cyclobacteriaceae bacterium]